MSWISFAEKIGPAVAQIPLTIMVCFAAYCTQKTFEALAGKETNANILASFFVNMEISRYVAYVLLAGTTGWALTERSLRKKYVKRAAPRLVQFEQIFDPNRTSSGLTATGGTPQGE